MRSIAYRLYNSKLYIYCCLALFLYPRVIEYNKAFNIGYSIIRYTIIIILSITIIVSWNISKTGRIFYYLILLYKGIFTISNIANHANISVYLKLLKDTIICVGVVAFVISAIEINQSLFVSCLRNLMLNCIIINLLLLICFPNGVAVQYMYGFWGAYIKDRCNFIDVDNRLSLFFILFTFIDWIYQEELYGYMKYWSGQILVGISALLIRSGTGLVAEGIILFYYIFHRFSAVRKTVSSRIIFIIYGMVYYLVVMKTNLFRDIIVNYLNRDMTISGRIYYWKYYLDLVKRHPLWGYGTATDGVYLISPQGFKWYAHSQAIDILVQGGIIALSAFIVILLYVSYVLNHRNNTYVSGIGMICLLSYLIMGIAEHFLIYRNVCFYIFLALMVADYESDVSLFNTGKQYIHIPEMRLHAYGNR